MLINVKLLSCLYIKQSRKCK